MSAPRRWLLGLTVALLALALAVQALALLDATWGFTTDDAYISLGYARHLLAGEGLRWKDGEAPAESYSNFSFVLAGAAALSAGFDPVLRRRHLTAHLILDGLKGSGQTENQVPVPVVDRLDFCDKPSAV